MRKTILWCLLLCLGAGVGSVSPQLNATRYESASGCHAPIGFPGQASLSAAVNELTFPSCLRIGRPLAAGVLATSAGDWTVTSNLTVPANIRLKLEPGPLLTPSTGVTLTLGSCPDAGPYRIFAGAGTVTFSPGACHFVYPEWWYDGGGNWLSALNKALEAVAASKGTMLLGAKTYPYTGELLYPAGVNIQGVSFRDTILQPSTGVGLTPTDPNAIYERNTFKDFAIVCSDSSAPYTCTVGLRLASARRNHLENLFVQFMAQDGILFSTGTGLNPFYNTLTNIWVRNVETGNCYRQVATGGEQPNATRIIGGHYGACATALMITDGSTGSVVGSALEGVTADFMSIGGNAWMMNATRMENNTYLGPDHGIVFTGTSVDGFTMSNTTLVGGSVVTTLLDDMSYCLTNNRINGEVVPDECPMKDMAGPLSQVGNPWACWGQEENLATATEALGASDWVTISGSLSVSSNTVVDPLGTSLADRITFTGSTNIRALLTTTTASGRLVYYGAWLKSPTFGRIQWELLATGGGGTEPVARGQWNLTPNWQYHYITHQFCTTGTGGCNIAAGDTIRLGFRNTDVDSMVDLLDVFGVQLGLGAHPRCYVTVGNAAPTVAARNKTTIRTKIDASAQSLRITSATTCDDSLFDVDDNATLCLDNDANGGSGALCVRVSGLWKCVNLN
jgi:hypothetical protein